MSSISRRKVLFLGSSSTFLAACDRLVLPPGEFLDRIEPITPTDEFYRYSYSGMPQFDAEMWTCDIEDVEGTVLATLNNDTLAGLTPVEFEHTLQCIGSGPRLQNISNAIFGGIPLAELFDDLGVSIGDGVVEMGFEGYDGYHDSFPITDLERPVWLVWEINGEPLPRPNGSPCRLIVPGRYGIKNCKWPMRFFFTDEPYQGYWQQQGWEKDGTYKPNTFIKSPPNLATVARNETVALLGTAYAGEDPVAEVEITFDDGETWEPCELDYAPGENIWALWRYEWTPSTRGRVRVRTRMTTESGAMTESDPGGTNRLAGYDGGMEVELVVS